MAVVLVFVGQCGSQLGDELLTQLALCRTAGASTAASPFFSGKGLARCVVVDTEPKVVKGVLHRHGDAIRPENVIYGQSGRGNNWGLGYHGVKTNRSKRNEKNAAVSRAFRNMARDQREEDDGVLARALRAIHAETRRTGDMESFEAILVLHSLVGGTGSGLASRLTEKIRYYFVEAPPGHPVDDIQEVESMRRDGIDGVYGQKCRARHLVHVAVAPQSLGEVATAGLNAALTLHILQRHSDAVILLRNDDAMAPGEANSSSVSPGVALTSRCTTFREANELLISMLLPVLGYGRERSAISRLVAHCAPPGRPQATGGNKILTILPTPQRTYGWLRGSVNRLLFLIVGGGRSFMPNYTPVVPVEELLSKSALRWWKGGQGGVAEQRGRDPLHRRLSDERRKRWNNDLPGRSSGDQPCTFVSHCSGADAEVDLDGGGMTEDEILHRVYQKRQINIPPPLYQHYMALRRAPVKKLFEEMEGIAVLNEALELNQRLLFPLLRSAAVKVQTGAFLSSYEDVGVTSVDVQRAYRTVAEILTTAAEL